MGANQAELALRRMRLVGGGAGRLVIGRTPGATPRIKDSRYFKEPGEGWLAPLTNKLTIVAGIPRLSHYINEDHPFKCNSCEIDFNMHVNSFICSIYHSEGNSCWTPAPAPANQCERLRSSDEASTSPSSQRHITTIAEMSCRVLEMFPGPLMLQCIWQRTSDDGCVRLSCSRTLAGAYPA